MTHTYCSDGPLLWFVGIYFPPNDEDDPERLWWDWHEIKCFKSEQSAARFTSFLNGGDVYWPSKEETVETPEPRTPLTNLKNASYKP